MKTMMKTMMKTIKKNKNQIKQKNKKQMICLFAALLCVIVICTIATQFGVQAYASEYYNGNNIAQAILDRAEL